LIISKGSTVAATITAVSIEPLLFDRIEAGRQAMPYALAVRIAAWLDASVGEVTDEVLRVSTTGALAGFNAVPASTIEGDDLPSVLLHPIETIDPTPPEVVVEEWVWVSSNGDAGEGTDDMVYVVDVVNENLVQWHDMTATWSATLRAAGLAYDATAGRVLCLGHDNPEVATIARFIASTAAHVDNSSANYGAQWGIDWGVTEGFWKDAWTIIPLQTEVQQIDGAAAAPMTILQDHQFGATPDAFAISLNLYEDGFAYCLLFDDDGAGDLYWERVNLSTGATANGVFNFVPVIGLGNTTQPIIDMVYTGSTLGEVYGLNVARIGSDLWTYAAGDPLLPPVSLPLYKTDVTTLGTTSIATVGVDVPGCWMGGCVVDDDGNIWVTSMKQGRPENPKTLHVHKLDTAGNVLAAYQMPATASDTCTYVGIGVFAAGTVWFVYRTENSDTESTTFNLGKFDKTTGALVSSIVLHANVGNPRGGLDIITTDVGPTTPVLPPGLAI
jgi:hypothetical protein